MKNLSSAPPRVGAMPRAPSRARSIARRIQRMATLIALPTAIWLTPWSLAHAHDGHDHGDETPAVATPQSVAPRAGNQTESFEVVAVLHEGKLTIYLDDFATNAPVDGAKVEVESGAFQASATRQSPGVYTAAAPALAKPGRHPLTITVETDEGADLLDATLDTTVAPEADEDTHEGHTHGPRLWPWAIAAILLLVVLRMAFTRFRRGGTTAPATSRQAEEDTQPARSANGS